MGSGNFVFKVSTQSLPVLLLILLSFWFYNGKMGLFPYHFHAWTQSDRLALAHGYLENNFSLLLPSTANLLPAYPPEKPLEQLNGITKADLPLTEFFVAAVMRLFQTQSPAVFRFTTLLLGLMGLFFFEKLLRKSGCHPLLSSFAMLVLMLSPVLSFYLIGVIPAIPALALSFGALFSYVLFLQSEKQKYYFWALALFTLAVLIRPPFLMPMLAMIAVQIWHDLKRPSALFVRLLPVTSVFIVIFAFYLYNNWLQQTFGSLFISSLMPADNVQNFTELIKTSWQNWKFDYLSPAHYLLLAVAMVALIFQRRKKLETPVKALLQIALLTLIAAAAYLFAMAKQFPDHDYYFLESFMLPIGLIIGLGLSQISFRAPAFKYVFLVASISLVIWMAFYSKNVMAERYTIHGWNMPAKTYLMFEGSADWLDEQGVDRNAKMLVLDAYTTNIPLLLMERKGFTVLNTTQQNIRKSMLWDFDYVTILNSSLLGDVLLNEPELRQKLKPVANNGRIGLYKIAESNSDGDAISLLLPFNSYRIHFSENTKLESSTVYLSIIDTILKTNNFQLNLLFQANVEGLIQPVENLYLVTDITHENGYRHYEVHQLRRYFEKPVADVAFEVVAVLPNNLPHDVRVKYYIWNPGKNSIVFKNQTVYLTKYLNT